MLSLTVAFTLVFFPAAARAQARGPSESDLPRLSVSPPEFRGTGVLVRMPKSLIYLVRGGQT